MPRIASRPAEPLPRPRPNSRTPAPLVEPAGSCYPKPMQRPILPIGPRQAILIACTAVLAVLVYAEGWIWPLKAAAIVIPISLLAG